MSFPGSVDGFRYAACRILGQGIGPADLLGDSSVPSTATTFAEYVPVVRAAVRDGSRRAYGPYWNKILEQWGARRLEEPTVS